MEAFAYKILQIGEAGSYVLSWIIMFGSAAVAVTFSNLEWRLGRANYFLSTGFIFLLSGMTSFLALGVQDAIKGGYLAVVVAAIYGLLIPIGGLAGLFAAARSLDGYGTKEKWAYGFIPILNLFLLFAKPEPPVRLGFARVLSNTAIVILGFLLMGAGKTIERTLTDTVSRSAQNAEADQVLQAKTMQYEIENKGIETVLKEAALQVPVPKKVDSITILKSVEVEGKTFRYIYLISSTKPKFGKHWKDTVMSRWCKSDAFKPMFDIGAVVAGRYQDTSGNVLTEISADPAICATWYAGLEAELVSAAASVKGPVKLDEITNLTGAAYASGTYSYYYTLAGDPGDGWQDRVKAAWCKTPGTRMMMEVGLNVQGVYRSERGTPVGTVLINSGICG